MAVADDDLMEWDYGALEGRTTAEIRAEMPGLDDLARAVAGGRNGRRGRRPGGSRHRADPRRATSSGDVLVFAHGHLLRVLAARWIGLPPASGGLFELATATLSILGWEREAPSIELWNEACHLV